MLDFEIALHLAARLTVVKEFPRNPEAIEATAEDFIDLTRECQPTEAERRVQWLIQEIRRTWAEGWTGTADMVRLFRSRYPLPKDPTAPPSNEVKDWGTRPPVECQACHDNGILKPEGATAYQWCECPAGIHLHFELPDWLTIVNREPPRVRKLVLPPEPTNPNYKPITAADIERAVEELHERRAKGEL
jgi:hypothetical protein